MYIVIVLSPDVFIVYVVKNLLRHVIEKFNYTFVIVEYSICTADNIIVLLCSRTLS